MSKIFRSRVSPFALLLLAPAMVGFASLAWGDDDCPKSKAIQGEWLAEDSFDHPAGELLPSMPCYRNYVCVSYNEAHGQSTMSDADCQRVYHYPPAKRRITGVCSAGGGPADSCNERLTNAPDDPCEYHYEHD
jgi:hypothetical protein